MSVWYFTISCGHFVLKHRQKIRIFEIIALSNICYIYCFIFPSSNINKCSRNKHRRNKLYILLFYVKVMLVPAPFTLNAHHSLMVFSKEWTFFIFPFFQYPQSSDTLKPFGILAHTISARWKKLWCLEYPRFWKHELASHEMVRNWCLFNLWTVDKNSLRPSMSEKY